MTQDIYDTTEQGSKFVSRVVGPKDLDPCFENHIWDVTPEPGAPVTCIVCGAEFRMTKREQENLLKSIERLTKGE
jgi:hypothetical protein